MSSTDPNGLSPRCWMCGNPADPGCATKLALMAPASRKLDGLGYPVKRGSQQDIVRLEVPRCTSCRNWTNDWIVVLIAATVMGAITGTILQHSVFSDVTPPSWLKVGFYRHPGIGNAGTAIGLMLGFVAVLCGMAVARLRSKRRSVNTYPPVVSLRNLGWRFATD